MDRQKLMSHLQGDRELEIGTLAIDAAELAWKTNREQVTDFMDPYEQKLAKSVLSGIPEVSVMSFGGHRQAERNRLVVVPQFYLTETIKAPIAVIEATGNFKFAQVNHRDYLGSLLALGIKREKIGDIIILDNGCQVVVAQELQDFLIQHWNQVHQVPIKVNEIDQEQLAIEPERVKEIKTTVASMRLDAIAAFGFSTSRTKMAREIKGERVKVNWKTVNNPAYEISENDVLSIRGRGRVIVEQVTGTTRKGRTGLILKRLM